MGFWGFVRTHLVPTLMMVGGGVIAIHGYVSQAYEVWTAGFEPWQIQATGAATFFVGVILTLYRFHQAHERAEHRAGIPALAPSISIPPTPVAEDAEEQEPIEALDAAPRVFLPSHVDPAALTNYFRGRTTAQARAAVAPYMGKWVRQQGRIGNVNEPSGGTVMVWFLHEGDFAELVNATVSFFFDEKWLPHLEHLQVGDPIALVGRIARVELMSTWINDCELVEPLGED